MKIKSEAASTTQQPVTLSKLAGDSLGNEALTLYNSPEDISK